MKIRITTDRLPQPGRHKGAEIDVQPEKAASMVAQGFAVIIDADDVSYEAKPTLQKRRRGVSK